VPKCAGTDLRIGLSTRYPALDVGLGRADWTSSQQLFAIIQQVAMGLRFADTILLHGHIRIVVAINSEIVRPIDKIITVIRDPVEIILSNVTTSSPASWMIRSQGRTLQTRGNGSVSSASTVCRRTCRMT
jgi:hypothetical protein